MRHTPRPSIVVGVFNDAAGVERATRALREARFAASDVGLEPGEEGRALDGPSGLLGALRGMGVAEPEARVYDAQHRAGNTILTVSAGARRAEAEAILRRSGALAFEDLGARGEDDGTLPPHGAEAAAVAPMQLIQEELVARKQLVETGSVVLRKEVVIETRLVEVQVRREQLVVKHAPLGAATPSPRAHARQDELEAHFRSLRPGETIRLELLEDEVVVRRRPVVYEEVVVGKRLVQHTQRLSATRRREQARIEAPDGLTPEAPAPVEPRIEH